MESRIYMNKKIKYIFHKFMSFLVITAFISSSTSIPTVIAYAKETISEQMAFHKILTDDSQKAFTDLPISKLTNTSTDIPLTQTKEQLQKKTKQQKSDEYKACIKKEMDSLSNTRYIIKYSDNNKYDKLIKKLDKSIKKRKKINGNKFGNYAVVETQQSVNQAEFDSLIDEGLKDGTIISAQPDYTVAASANLSNNLITDSPDVPSVSPVASSDLSNDSTTDASDADVSSQPSVTPEADVTGSAIVALIDSGIDMSHPDLKGEFYTNTNEIANNGSDDDNNGYVDDVCGWDFFNKNNAVNDSNISDEWHGTHIAGLIADQKNRNIKILPIKVFEGGVAYTSDIIDAIHYADGMGAKIINCSWGSRFDSPALEEAIAESDALFVCATGNDLYNLDIYPVYPAAYSKTHSNVISVAAVDKSSKLWRSSNYGVNTVDIAAPGFDINSTWINGEYRKLSGTSMSAGIVSGIATQILAKNPLLTAHDIKKRIVDSASSVTGLQDKIIGGKLLDEDFAFSENTAPNTNVINIPDTDPLREVIPNANSNENPNNSLFGAENYVTTKTSMLTARHGLQVVTLNNKIYAIGGQTTATAGFTNIVQMYDPTTDKWTAKKPMNYSRSYFGAVVYNGKIYAIGGQNSATTYLNNVEVYDPSADTWTVSSGSMPSAKCGFSTTLIPNTSNVYIIGGINGSNYSNSVYKYDISKNSWSSVPSLIEPVAGHIGFYYKGKIFIEGGYTTGSYPTYSEYSYNITTGITESGPPNGPYLKDASGVIIGEKCISIGGKDENNIYYGGILNFYLFTQDGWDGISWYSTNHLLTARSGHGSVYLNGKVYVLGGLNGTGILSSLEVIDLGYQQKASLPVATKDYGTAELNGKIFVMGGITQVNGSESHTKSVYMYDPSTDKWTRMADLPVYLSDFLGVSAYGKIYIFGGSTLNGDSNAIYEYNPANNNWAIKQSTIYTKYSKPALFNGKIYIAGGYINYDINKVVQYDPLTDTLITKNDLPTGMFDTYLSVIANKLYLFQRYSSDVLEYDTLSDKWTSVAVSGEKYGNLMATVGDNIYTLGFDDNEGPFIKYIYKYLPNDKTWTNFRSFSYFGDFLDVVSANNKAYLLSGSNGYCSGLVEYCPTVSPWSMKPENGYTDGAGSVVLDNNIYVTGGHDGGTKTLSVYNDITGWNSDLPTMNYGHAYHGMALANKKLYVIGGESSTTTSYIDASNSVEEYDVALKKWTIKKAYPYNIKNMAVASYNNKVYVFGGQDNNGNTLPYVYMYDPALNTWTNKGNMNTPCYGSGAAVIGSKIYVVGGFKAANSTSPTNILQVYDPLNNTWSTKAALPKALGYAGVVAKDNLYVIDGFDGSSIQANVYEYSPILNQWFKWTGPDESRYYLSAAMTDKGIYVMGGIISGYYSTTTVEYTSIDNLYNSADLVHFGEDTINPSGNFSRTYIDSTMKTQGFDLNIARTYNSGDERTTGNIISEGWTFGFQGKIDTVGNSTSIRLPNGSGSTFRLNANGSYTAKDSRNTLVKQSDGTYLYTTSDQYTYVFNSAGYLTYMSDSNGNKITITIDSTGNPTQITDAAGRYYTISYDTSSRISKITDPVGNYVSYGYDINGRLSSVCDAMGYYTYYSYDTNGLLTSIKDNNNNIIESVTYLPPADGNSAKVKTTTDKFGNVTTFKYLPEEGRLDKTDSKGRVTSTWFDSMLYPIRTKDAEGKETRTTYSLDDGLNKYGETSSSTDRNGNTTFYERDIKGNIIRQINPDCSIKTFTYDTKNNKLSETDEKGKSTYYTYDSGGNLLKTAKPLNGTSTYSGTADQSLFSITTNVYYTGDEALSLFKKKISGLLKSTTDPEGGVTSYTYDTNGNIATITDARGKITIYQYNKMGWLKSVKTPLGYTTTYYYDKNGLITKEVLHGGETTRTLYDFRGNITQKIMPVQYLSSNDTSTTFSSENILNSATNTYNVTTQGYRYIYGTNGTLTTLTDPLGNITSYTYDTYGNNLTETKPNGSIYLNAYDVMNRVTSKSFKKNASDTATLLNKYSYSVVNNCEVDSVTQYFDASTSLITKTTYDYAKRPVRVDNPDNTYITNIYNANGTLYKSVDANSNSTYYDYDGLNRLTNTWQSIDNSTYAFSTLQYDKAGRIIKETKALNPTAYGTVPTSGLIWTSHTYYPDGKLKSDTDSAGSKKEYNYSNDGNLSSEYTYTTSTKYKEVDYTYNYLNKIASKNEVVYSQDITGYETAYSNINLTTSYTYDKDGNLYTETNPEGTIITYSYDLMERMLSNSQPGINENGSAVTITKSMTYDSMGNMATSTNELNKTTTYTYNEQGFLTKVTDPNDGISLCDYDLAGRKTVEVSPQNKTDGDITTMNRTVYVYDNLNRLKTVTQIYSDPTTNTLKNVVTKAMTYDGNGNITYQQDALGYQKSYGTVYKYDYANRMIQETNPENGVTKKVYDAAARLLSETDANGFTTEYTYNDAGQTLTTTKQNILTQSNTYDLAGNLLTQADGNGNLTSYTYNSLFKPSRITLPGDNNIAALTTTYRYTILGLPAEQCDSIGKCSVITYDKQGHKLTETEKKVGGTQAITLSYKYDQAGNLKYQNDGNDIGTGYDYDSLNHKISSRNNISSSYAKILKYIIYTYDKNDNKTSETTKISLANSPTLTYNYSYDPINRLIKKTDPAGNAIETIFYNDNDVQTQSVDALGHATNYFYDRNNRLVKTQNPLNACQLQAYDSVGNVISKTDANGNVTSYTYDAFNRLTDVKDALNQDTSYTYDPNGNLLTQSDGNGNVTTIRYNARNLPVMRIDAGGILSDGSVDLTKAESYTYNADGKLATKTDRNGLTISYSYDIHGHMLSQTGTDSNVSYTYDNNGNQLTMTDASGTTTYTYDWQNKMRTKVVPGISGTTTYQLDQIYNVDGAYYMSDVSTDAEGNITKKIYDKAGRLWQVINGSNTTTYSYYANGNKKSVTYPNGTSEEYTYYDDNRLNTLANKNGILITEAYKYTYDANGNQLTKLDIKGTTTYVYDDLNRLSQVADYGNKNTDYTYDASGNRLTEKVTVGADTTNTANIYNEQNRLISTQIDSPDGTSKLTSYDYDNNGNMLSKATSSLTNPGEDQSKATYEYDDNCNMTKATVGTNSTVYLYNADNLCVRKEITSAGSTDITQYLYQGNKVILEADGTGEQKNFKLYGNDDLISNATSGKVTYFQYNGHCDVTLLTGEDGTTVGTYYYDAFGNVLDHTGADSNITYAGYQWNSETGLYYLNARMYDPVTARFMQQDTYIGELNDPLSLNLYTYVTNNPIMYTDPTGHKALQFGLKKNNDVKQLQENLMALGYNLGNCGADGNFGRATEAAVIQYQKNNGLKVDGKAGRQTINSINYKISCSNYNSYYTSLANMKTLEPCTAVKQAREAAKRSSKASNEFANNDNDQIIINPTLKQIIKLDPSSPIYEGAANEGQKYYLAWYYGTKAYERLDEATLNHSSYLVFDLNGLSEEDLSKLTVYDLDKMCVKNESFWSKADLAALTLFGGYYIYLEGAGKTVDDIIQAAKETTNGKGVAKNFEKSGGYSQTVKDFGSLNPTNVKEIQTKYGTGYVGTLSDGTTVVARPGSTTGGATLEINISNSKVYKVRY